MYAYVFVNLGVNNHVLMRKLYIFSLLVFSCLQACEPFNLERHSFKTCEKPSAAIAYIADDLTVEFFLAEEKGEIGSVGWDLGDGQNRVGKRFVYGYQKPGTYTVSILIANSCNDVVKVSKQITVSK
jgi:hypothetical protein